MIGSIVDVDDDGGACFARAPHGGKRRASARFVAQARTGDEYHAHVRQRCTLHVFKGNFPVGAIVTIEGERESIGRLNREDDRARPASGLSRDELRLDAFLVEKRKDEIAHLVVAHGCQQRRSQPEPLRADADICRTSADVRVEALHFRDRHADLVRVEIEAAPANGEHVVGSRARRRVHGRPF